MGQDDAFRQMVRAWLETNCPQQMRGPMSEGDHCFGGLHWQFKNDAQRDWLARMAARGWTAPEWPQAFGGGGLSPTEASILRDEMARIDAHQPLTSLGIWMLGPALLRFGTDAQKSRHLPPITRGEIRWCQGYSEPNAGSDLASLQTRAEITDSGFVVTGQKIWTSYGHLADWIFCLVRTDPSRSRQDGISFLLIDMTSPGVQAAPLRLLSGAEHFSQVFFDQVFVPRENLVGELHRGWDVAKYLLLFERQMIGAFKPALDDRLIDFALKYLGAEALRAEPQLRAQIINLDMKLSAFDTMLERYRDEALAGAPPSAASSMLKYFATELNVKRYETMLSILGVAGVDLQGPDGRIARQWLGSLANRIGGGTSEIQLNVIAKRVLNLPGG